MLCFFNVTATTEIYTTYTLFPYTTRFRSSARGPRRERRSSGAAHLLRGVPAGASAAGGDPTGPAGGAADRRDRPRRRGIRGLPAGGAFRLPRSEEHTSELQSLMRISYAVFCLKKKNATKTYKKMQ